MILIGAPLIEVLTSVTRLIENSVRVFSNERAFDTWLAGLHRYKAQPYENVLPGHGAPGGKELYNRARELLSMAADRDDLKARFIAAFPDFGGRPLLDHQKRFLFSPRKGGEGMEFLICFFGVLLVSSPDESESAQAKIARAMSAGPLEIARPHVSSIRMRMVVLREGSNGFHVHARKSESDRRFADVRGCPVDAVGRRFQSAQAEADEHGSRNHLLAGATQRSDSDPYDTTSQPITVPPHWMIMWPVRSESHRIAGHPSRYRGIHYVGGLALRSRAHYGKAVDHKNSDYESDKCCALATGRSVAVCPPYCSRSS
jgi:hypothetical protein